MKKMYQWKRCKRRPSVVFTCEGVANESFSFQNSTNIHNSMVENDASHLYPPRCVIPCQHVPRRVGISIRTPTDSRCWKRTPSFDYLFISCSNESNQTVKVKAFFTKNRGKKVNHFSVDGFFSHSNTEFEAMFGFYNICAVKEVRSSTHLSLNGLSNVGVRRDSSVSWHDAIYWENDSLSLECGVYFVDSFQLSLQRK